MIVEATTAKGHSMNRYLPAMPLIALLCFSFSFTSSCAQTNSLNGVYAGIEISLPTVMGQGMNRTDRVILFRPDGTFNENMRKPDWKTAITGRYTIKGNEVTLQYNGGSKEYMQLEKDGDLKASGGTGSYGILKMAIDNSVPPGLYKFSNISSTGGGASGQVFVGSSKDIGLYFDGKGYFNRRSKSATMIAGNQVGGGTSNKDNAKGTYTIKDGILLLQYADGKTETHSFFCRPSEKPLMAAINGNIYFMDEEQAAATQSAAAKPATNTKPVVEAATPNTANSRADARTQMYKANQVQGGTALDQLSTLKVSGTVNGMTVVSMADLAKGRIRIEWRKGTALVGIEQLDAGQGWQWQHGKKTTLSNTRKEEMQSGLYSGTLGLRKQVIVQMKDLEIKQLPENNLSISCKVNGTDHIYVFNEKGQLIGDASGSNGQGSVSMYGNLKMVDGILLPFSEKLRINGQTVQIQYNRYEINPVFSETDWAEK
jgi:hypothetical protein